MKHRRPRSRLRRAATAALEEYEERAERFHKETGMLAPGKDQPAAMGGYPTLEEREAAWRAWIEKERSK